MLDTGIVRNLDLSVHREQPICDEYTPLGGQLVLLWRLCSRAVSALDALCACTLNWICGCVTLAHSRADCMYTNAENKSMFVSA